MYLDACHDTPRLEIIPTGYMDSCSHIQTSQNIKIHFSALTIEHRRHYYVFSRDLSMLFIRIYEHQQLCISVSCKYWMLKAQLDSEPDSELKDYSPAHIREAPVTPTANSRIQRVEAALDTALLKVLSWA